MVIGSGGVFTEVLGDTATLFAPFEPAAVARELERLHIGRLPRGSRGIARTDLGRTNAAATLARYAIARPDIASVDLNQLIVLDDGSDLWVLGLKVVVAEEVGG